jgi:hypothetical protein
MNTLTIIVIILLVIIIWIIYGINKDKKIYQNYAFKNNWKYSRHDKDYHIYELLKSSIFYKVAKLTGTTIRHPYYVYNILTKDNEIVCTASTIGRASGLLPDFLIYHNNIELPKLFIISKTSFLVTTTDINYYKDEFDEIDIGLSTDTHVIIVNSHDKEILLPKVKKIMYYFPDEHHLMIRNGKLVIYTSSRKVDFQKFILKCQKINENLT